MRKGGPDSRDRKTILAGRTPRNMTMSTNTPPTRATTRPMSTGGNTPPTRTRVPTKPLRSSGPGTPPISIPTPTNRMRGATVSTPTPPVRRTKKRKPLGAK